MSATAESPFERKAAPGGQGGYGVPVGGRAPVGLHLHVGVAVAAVRHSDGAAVPLGGYAEEGHQPQRHGYVGLRDHLAFEVQLQALLHHGRHHHQCRYVLAAHVPRQADDAARQPSPLDVERGVAFGLGVVDAGAQLPERVHKDAYGALLHALAARYGVAAVECGQIGRQESHRRAGRAHVHKAHVRLQRLQHHGRVVACRQVGGQAAAAAQHVQQQQAVADALRGGQCYGAPHRSGCCYGVSHCLWLLLRLVR